MRNQELESTDSQAKKSLQKLQKTIVNALEDVKAADIRVFNTETISPLFERVIIASGNSNRQTKALAANVREQLKNEGFAKPRSEGEENGEWIIVDCGAAVVHIMQPAIRQYYHLEDIWGEKPVRLRSAQTTPTRKTTSTRETKRSPKTSTRSVTKKSTQAAPVGSSSVAPPTAKKSATSRTKRTDSTALASPSQSTSQAATSSKKPRATARRSPASTRSVSQSAKSSAGKNR